MSNSFATPWTVAHQAPLSMGFSRRESWSGLPCPPPGDLPALGMEPISLTAGGSCSTNPPGKPTREPTGSRSPQGGRNPETLTPPCSLRGGQRSADHSHCLQRACPAPALAFTHVPSLCDVKGQGGVPFPSEWCAVHSKSQGKGHHL